MLIIYLTSFYLISLFCLQPGPWLLGNLHSLVPEACILPPETDA
jgi:hypothetical protein